MEVYYPFFSYLALTSLLFGVIFGALYDVFRLFRVFTFKNAVVVFIEDILFFLIVGVMFSVIFFNYTNGRVRLYALLCAASGFSVYYFTVGKLTEKTAKYIMNALKKLFLLFVSLVKRVYLPIKRKLNSKAVFYKKVRFASHGFGLIKKERM